MPSPFAITTAANAVSLDTQRHSEVSFTVSNTSGNPIRGRAQLATEAIASAAWLTLTEDAEQNFPTGSTQQYTVKIAVPPDTPAGTYSFRLNMVGVENPDELFTQGPTVTFQVPEPEPKKPFPWWIVIVAVGALALCCALGVGGYLVATNLPTPTPTPSITPSVTPSATPTRTPTPSPDKLLIGKWRGIDKGGSLVDMVFAENGQITLSAVENPGLSFTGTYDVDFSSKPGHLDVEINGNTSPCLIEFIDDDTILIECSSERPAGFSGDAVKLQRR